MFGFLKKAALGEKYSDQVMNRLKELTTSGQFKISANDDAPFRLKKNELLLGSVNATLGTYKNNGNFAYSALTARVKIAPGVNYRIGVGEMGMDKSWVFDQPGILYITSQRIIFNGINTNTSVTFNKILNMGPSNHTGTQFYVDRETGKDLMFKLDQAFPIDTMATLLAFFHMEENLKIEI